MTRRRESDPRLDQGADPSGLDENGSPARRRWHPLVYAVLGLGIIATISLAYLSTRPDGLPWRGDAQEVTGNGVPRIGGDTVPPDEAAELISPAAPDSEGRSGGESSGGESIGESTAAGATAVIPPPETGPFVAARLNLDAVPGAGMVMISGRVPDQATADAVMAAAQVAYAPFVESELVVDETLSPEPWLAAGPAVVGLLPGANDGMVMVSEGQVRLSLRSNDEKSIAYLAGGVEQLTGLPVDLVDVNITGLQPPLFNVDFDEGQATLRGYVASEQLVEALYQGAVSAYGADNVVNELTVQADTYQSFWMYTMPVTYQLFAVFPSYEFTVENAQLSGSIRGGVNFAADSSDVRDDAAQALSVGVSVLARDLSIGMVVTGHTDADGSDQYNLALSTERAQAVVDYFVAAGIEETRMLAVGAGESEPVASNETDEGKALNRRVAFAFGPADLLAG